VRREQTSVQAYASKDACTGTYVTDNVIAVLKFHFALQVTGIVGRADVLACIFFLLSFLAYHG
jgi:hypothetical protein